VVWRGQTPTSATHTQAHIEGSDGPHGEEEHEEGSAAARVGRFEHTDGEEERPEGEPAERLAACEPERACTGEGAGREDGVLLRPDEDGGARRHEGAAGRQGR